MTYIIDQNKLEWRKASKSGPNGNCVEMAKLADGSIAMRDSKQNGHGPVLQFTPAEMDAFLDGAQRGEFDDLAKTTA